MKKRTKKKYMKALNKKIFGNKGSNVSKVVLDYNAEKNEAHTIVYTTSRNKNRCRLIMTKAAINRIIEANAK